MRKTIPGAPPEKLKLEDLDLRQWNASILEDEADEMLERLEEGLLPWLRISEKMGVHIHLQAASITAIKKNKAGSLETVKKLTERVGPVIALKEDVDEYLSTTCTRLLEQLEARHEQDNED